ncbi:zinc ribbon domain-containing protein [Halorubrum sp. Atlit-26R]|uniref:zinc ribbon domain-containing protein n=1 Tax=Halorubrum sp. Atlit-26R TaxID=2282128 RepID=UPI000EF18898|nr:zinc ribbon domain-containing protein [Halorubrum sp. Atlit-26R]RLM63044.1 zinc ribbon domain-containing protein [Halorubrum sp. Atlit-26R]
MKTCPRCDSSLDDEARYCVECGTPQTEDAADELNEFVQRQAQQVAAESEGGVDGDEDGGSGFVPTEELTDREQLWRRGCYVLGYGTIVVALTLVQNNPLSALPLILAGIAILPPIRRLTAEPLGSPLKREVMAGIYAVFALIGIALFVLLG